jgi:IMP dehydrogenase/GMP reductase
MSIALTFDDISIIPWHRNVLPSDTCVRSPLTRNIVGARNIKELFIRAKWVQVTQAGRIESHPHDVQNTKELPNYTEYV